MNRIMLVPFAYFYRTRLYNGALTFHALFEWVAAAWIVAFTGASNIACDWLHMVSSYIAFICLYELGYIVNDFFSAPQEVGGRRRVRADIDSVWLMTFIFIRLAVFVAITIVFGQFYRAEWWVFFLALTFTFALHNTIQDPELKTATFPWLAWFRFMAPVTFVIEDDQRMGIAFAVAMTYVGFRNLGYLDSKGLLKMPGRRRDFTRWMFFNMPLVGALSVWSYNEAEGYILLTFYWGIMATLGTLYNVHIRRNPKKES